MATGVVTTARLTHATPAATYAHVPNRNWENDTDLPAEAVAARLHATSPGRFVESRFGHGPTVALGGGRGEFMPTIAARPANTTTSVGQRLRRPRPGRRMAAPRIREGAYVWNTRQFAGGSGRAAICSACSIRDHMQFDHDRDTGRRRRTQPRRT